jgi:hypothetical protein
LKGNISAISKAKIALPTIITAIADIAWLIVVFDVVHNTVKNLSIDKINQISSVLIQSSGILIGFVGISAFFFIGKIGDLALGTYKEALKTSNLLNNCKLLSENAFMNIEGTEQLTREEKEKIQRLRARCEKCENEHKELLKKMKQTLSKASMTTHLVTAFQVSMFALSLILCLIAILTNDGSYLEESVTFLGLGLIFLVYYLYAAGSVTESITDILNGFQSMNEEIRLHTREKARMEHAPPKKST